MAFKVCPNCNKEFDNKANSKICPDCQKIRVKVICDNPECGKEIKLSSRKSREYLSGKKKDHYFCSKKCAAGGYLYCDFCGKITYHGAWSVCMCHDNPGSRENVQRKNRSLGSWGIRTDLIFGNVTICTKSWGETVFALYLYFNNIIFKYEDKKFYYYINKVRHVYYPDFYLPEFNYIVEIKGYQKNPSNDKIAGQSVIDNKYNFEVIKNIDFFCQGILNNTNINLDLLYKNSKLARDNKCIFEYEVPEVGSFYGS